MHSFILLLLGCNSATTRFTRRSASMSELTNNCEADLFAPVSKEHSFFAGTLRNWSDPVLPKQSTTSVPLCARCVGCRCESLKSLPRSSSSLSHSHHRHDPSCPNYRLHERAKTSSRPRLVSKPKRRANSCEPIILTNGHTSSMKHIPKFSPSSSPFPPLSKRTQSISKIPVRIRSSTFTTAPREPSPSSSSITTESQSSTRPSKIPRPVSNHYSSSKSLISSTDQDLDQDR